MGLIKTALKTAVAVKTAHVVHDRIQRRKQAEWVAAGHTPESFPGVSAGQTTTEVVGTAASWLGISPAAATAPARSQAETAAQRQPMVDVLAQLRELSDLRDVGVLTDAEFAAQKERILGD